MLFCEVCFHRFLFSAIWRTHCPSRPPITIIRTSISFQPCSTLRQSSNPDQNIRWLPAAKSGRVIWGQALQRAVDTSNSDEQMSCQHSTTFFYINMPCWLKVLCCSCFRWAEDRCTGDYMSIRLNLMLHRWCYSRYSCGSFMSFQWRRLNASLWEHIHQLNMFIYVKKNNAVNILRQRIPLKKIDTVHVSNNNANMALLLDWFSNLSSTANQNPINNGLNGLKVPLIKYINICHQNSRNS